MSKKAKNQTALKCRHSTTPVQVPARIVEAARTVQDWMQANGGDYWQLMGICDRRFAYKIELIRAELEAKLRYARAYIREQYKERKETR